MRDRPIVDGVSWWDELDSDDDLTRIVRMPASPRNMQKPDRAMLEALKSAAIDEMVNRGYDPDAVRWG